LKTSRPKTKTGKPPAKRKDVIVLNLTPAASGSTHEYRQQRYEELSIRAIVEQGGADYILSRPNHPYYMQMLQFVTERAWGKVPQEVNNRIGPLPAVALPLKEPEQFPDAQVEVLPAPAVVAGLLLPAKDDDGSVNHLVPAGGAADDVSPGQ
jgi:hypothetical protein